MSDTIIENATKKANDGADLAKDMILVRELHDSTIKNLEIKKTFILFGISIKFEMKSKDRFMGRFGGGWQFFLGLKATKSTWYVGLGIASLYITKHKK